MSDDLSHLTSFIAITDGTTQFTASIKVNGTMINKKELSGQTHRQLFERGLKLLVIGGGGSVDDLLLAPGGALATDANLGLQLLQLLRVHAGLEFQGRKPLKDFAVGSVASAPE